MLTWVNIGNNIERAKVFGGWLLVLREPRKPTFCMTFMPDPKHKWDIEEDKDYKYDGLR